MSAQPEFAGLEPAYANHPFSEAERLFVFRRPPTSEPMPGNPNVARLHPSAKRAELAVRRLAEFQEKYPQLGIPEMILVNTHPTTALMTQEFYRHGITNHDGVVIVGGDGNASKGDAAARDAGFEGPIQQMASGYACDLAHMLFRAREIKRPGHAMVKSRTAKLHPLTIRYEVPGQGTVTQEAEYCASLGNVLYGVGKAASGTDYRYRTENMHIVSKFVTDITMTKREVSTAQGLLRIEDDNGKQHARYISDMVFTNGWRMAKHVRFTGVRLLEPGFGRVELKHPTIHSVLGTFAVAKSGRFPHYEADESYSFRVFSEDGTPIKVQKDGETDSEFEIPSGAEVTIETSPRWTNQATTRIHT